MSDEKRWIKSIKYPHSVGWAGASRIFEINSICYVVGTKGVLTLNSDFTYFNEFYKFPLDKKYADVAACRVGNKIFVVYYGRHGNYKEIKLFNTINKQWIDAKIKIKRKFFAVVYYLNKVWIIGGRERVDDGNWKRLNTVEVYDPVGNNLSLAPTKMNQTRSSHSVIVYKNKLFVFGGYDDHPLNTVEMISPLTKKFVMMAPMKTARSKFACCRVGNLVYVIGGRIGDGKTNSVEFYNLDSNTWTDGGNFPIAQSDLYACAVNN